MTIAWKNQELNEQLTKLVLDNEITKNLLLERENKIKAKQDELDERQKDVRREEIEITARKAETRKNEQLAAEQQKNLEAETKRVKERELEAEKVKTKSENEKEKYQSLYDELEIDKENINTLEEAARRKNKEAETQTAAANAIFEKAKVIDEEIKAKETKFEEHRESIEKSLNEKIAEYDRRIEDLNAVKGIVDDVKFDKSNEGKEAKIVVKEAIRQAKKALTDIKTKFEELDEKYSSGSFKGFATPLSEIDKSFEELKSQYLQINEHFSSEENLPPSVSQWLGSIEESINNADKYIKSWEFSEAYRNIVWGLSTCKNYVLLLTILNDFANPGTEDIPQNEEDDFEDWYDILEVESDADEKVIKKAYRDAAKKHHPDKNNGDKESEGKFKKVAEAYEILSDPDKRKAFDEKRNNRKQKK
ncbi:MAG: DnaJ domain-containing protein [Bacteroidetes bacterium]|nr:DnaJ domain-containing protein [Bacteroidota bacterium]